MPSATAKTQRKRKPRNVFTLPEKAKALSVLDHFGGNATFAAKHLGIPRTSLIRIVEQAKRNDEFAEKVRLLRQENNAALGPASIDTAWEALVRMKELIPTAQLRDATVAYGMSVERGLILNGMPNHIHATVTNPALAPYTVEELRAMRAKMVQGTVVDAPALSAGSDMSLPSGHHTMSDAQAHVETTPQGTPSTPLS